jgi:hypothetical protein
LRFILFALLQARYRRETDGGQNQPMTAVHETHWGNHAQPSQASARPFDGMAVIFHQQKGYTMNEQDFMLCQVFGATDEIEAAKAAAYEWLNTEAQNV